MPVKFECSDCGTALKVKEQSIGRKIRCPHCDAVKKACLVKDTGFAAPSMAP
jgi:DNA-directed RNA polymerase subunit M/transcription elongation factor TFIIS